MTSLSKDKIFGIRPYLKGLMGEREAFDYGFRLAEHFNEPLQSEDEKEMDQILLANKAGEFINNLIEELKDE